MEGTEQDMKELAGKVALVTGGSRGIGAAIVRRLAQQGATVAFTYVSSADKARAVAKQIDADMNPADGPGAGFLRGVPALGRYGHVDDIATTVVHLAGDGGRYVTGTAITVDGGFAA
jgi:NAD(P)-dependent dehydrogenase (short-subunit alcohol dehydrogenase family)